MDAEGRRGGGGRCSFIRSLLRLPDEVLLEIISFLPMLQVSRLSQVCSRLKGIIGPGVLKRGVLVHPAGDYVSLLRH